MIDIEKKKNRVEKRAGLAGVKEHSFEIGLMIAAALLFEYIRFVTNYNIEKGTDKYALHWGIIWGLSIALFEAWLASRLVRAYYQTVIADLVSETVPREERSIIGHFVHYQSGQALPFQPGEVIRSRDEANLDAIAELTLQVDKEYPDQIVGTYYDKTSPKFFHFHWGYLNGKLRKDLPINLEPVFGTSISSDRMRGEGFHFFFSKEKTSLYCAHAGGLVLIAQFVPGENFSDRISKSELIFTHPLLEQLRHFSENSTDLHQKI